MLSIRFVVLQRCYVCGDINKEARDLSIREWEYPECQTKHNRDINAAINIKKAANRIAALLRVILSTETRPHET